jgi:uncharacterized protein (UPF0218 family)
LAIVYVLTPELRIKLKEPIGTLIQGSFVETVKKFRDMVKNETSPEIISVGDTVSKNLAENGLFPRLVIVDNRVMRKDIRPISLRQERTIHLKNPQGTITGEAISAIREALENSSRTKIVVEGEEDLLALIAVLYAPEDSFVVYGQPREGMVVVKVTPEKRAEVAQILKAMENVRKN